MTLQEKASFWCGLGTKNSRLVGVTKVTERDKGSIHNEGTVSTM